VLDKHNIQYVRLISGSTWQGWHVAARGDHRFCVSFVTASCAEAGDFDRLVTALDRPLDVPDIATLAEMEHCNASK
jgi:hypothetical protein